MLHLRERIQDLRQRFRAPSAEPARVWMRRDWWKLSLLGVAIVGILTLDSWLFTCGFAGCPSRSEIRAYKPSEGGRQIVLATDRPIGFWEARNQPRSIDYPFTILEMRLDKNDQGSGKILAGTKIYIDKNNNLVLENYGQQPVMFNEIKRVK